MLIQNWCCFLVSFSRIFTISNYNILKRLKEGFQFKVFAYVLLIFADAVLPRINFVLHPQGLLFKTPIKPHFLHAFLLPLFSRLSLNFLIFFFSLQNYWNSSRLNDFLHFKSTWMNHITTKINQNYFFSIFTQVDSGIQIVLGKSFIVQEPSLRQKNLHINNILFIKVNIL